MDFLQSLFGGAARPPWRPRRLAAVQKRAIAAIHGSRQARWRSQRLARNALRSRLDYLLAERDALEYMPAYNPAEKARMIQEVHAQINALRREKKELDNLSLANLRL